MTPAFQLVPSGNLDADPRWWLAVLNPAVNWMTADSDLARAWSAALRVLHTPEHRHRASPDDHAALDEALARGVPAAWLVEHACALTAENPPRTGPLRLLCARFGASWMAWPRSRPPSDESVRAVQEADREAKRKAHEDDEYRSYDEDEAHPLDDFFNEHGIRERIRELRDRPLLAHWAFDKGSASLVLEALLLAGWNPAHPLPAGDSVSPFVQSVRQKSQAWALALWKTPEVRADQDAVDEALWCLARSTVHDSPAWRDLEVALIQAGDPNRAFPIQPRHAPEERETAGYVLASRVVGGGVAMSDAQAVRLWGALQPRLKPEEWVLPPGAASRFEHELRYAPSELAAPTQGIVLDALDVLAGVVPGDRSRWCQLAAAATSRTGLDHTGWPLRWLRDRQGSPWGLEESVAAALAFVDHMQYGATDRPPALRPVRAWSAGMEADDAAAWESAWNDAEAQIRASKDSMTAEEFGFLRLRFSAALLRPGSSPRPRHRL